MLLYVNFMLFIFLIFIFENEIQNKTQDPEFNSAIPEVGVAWTNI